MVRRERRTALKHAEDRYELGYDAGVLTLSPPFYTRSQQCRRAPLLPSSSPAPALRDLRRRAPHRTSCCAQRYARRVGARYGWHEGVRGSIALRFRLSSGRYAIRYPRTGKQSSAQCLRPRHLFVVLGALLETHKPQYIACDNDAGVRADTAQRYVKGPARDERS
ncbi:uncharacterized protein TRAVEDRAFT_50286 [Trametes versicolor FP-101664 SS1]|uniref:uncharacterized protein n=1 Tax=Trametes versicolor (strain FP-101664) TaxID=717944 RepID=UPI000462226B|nr:uncharacterized protein TRAVEDRAFT_50286 [Trametes versicolor FP-101664 SS1]EIW55803.1 hypothetical protein TRAVEDRAFT_50286 [Trametes versicolor FP-101664 SS1]